MLFRGGGPRANEQGQSDWRVPYGSRRRGGISQAIFWSRLTKVLLLMLFITLVVALYRAKDIWPKRISMPTPRSDYVDPDKLINDPGLDPLPRVTSQAFFDIEIDGEYVGRVVMGVFGDTVPRTANNFLTLCSGEKGAEMHYNKMRFHRIIPGFIVQGGDIVKGDGTGSVSIYGSHFDDEAAGLALKHDRPYLLQMANSGRNTNGSQFCFMLGPAPHLNGHHVVFGRVLSGFHVVDKMGQAGESTGRPLKNVVVVNSGLVYPPS